MEVKQLDDSWLAQFLFDNSRECMAFVAPNGVILRANPAFHYFLGYEAGTLTDKHFADITFGDDIEGDLADFRLVIDGTKDSYERRKRYRHRDDRAVFANLLVRKLPKMDSVEVVIYGAAMPMAELPEEQIEQVVAKTAARVEEKVLGEDELNKVVDQAVVRIQAAEVSDETKKQIVAEAIGLALLKNPKVIAVILALALGLISLTEVLKGWGVLPGGE